MRATAARGLVAVLAAGLVGVGVGVAGAGRQAHHVLLPYHGVRGHAKHARRVAGPVHADVPALAPGRAPRVLQCEIGPPEQAEAPPADSGHGVVQATHLLVTALINNKVLFEVRYRKMVHSI